MIDERFKKLLIYKLKELNKYDNYTKEENNKIIEMIETEKILIWKNELI